jgi:hypothetical protein
MRYQLHPASATTQYHNGNTDAHSQKKKINKKKTRHGILALAATIQPPPRQHLNFMLSKSNAFKKETVQKHHRGPIKDLRFSP